MDVYEALADPTRRGIVAMLASGERSAGDIADRFPIAGPSVSRHLKVLRESGLIAYRQQATSRFYRLEPQPLEVLAHPLQAGAVAVHRQQLQARRAFQQMGGLAAGRGAGVEHALARPRLHQLGGELGGGVLHR